MQSVSFYAFYLALMDVNIDSYLCQCSQHCETTRNMSLLETSNLLQWPLYIVLKILLVVINAFLTQSRVC